MHGCDSYYDASKNIICELGEIKESNIIPQCILGNTPCTTTTLLRPPTPPPTCDILIPVGSCDNADPMHGCDSYYDASKNILCEDDRLSEQCILGNTMCTGPPSPPSCTELKGLSIGECIVGDPPSGIPDTVYGHPELCSGYYTNDNNICKPGGGVGEFDTCAVSNIKCLS